jgi:signal transduction histidine kinase
MGLSLMGWFAPRLPWRASGSSAFLLLTALMIAAFQLEHRVGLHDIRVGIVGFNLLPVLLGIAFLTARQALLLGVANVGLLCFELARDATPIQHAAIGVISRVLIVALSVWIAGLRSDIERQRSALARKAEDLESMLNSSLRASSLAHEIRQPLSVILLSTRLLQDKLDQSDAPDPDCIQHLQQLQACANQLNLTIAAMGALMRSVQTVHGRLDLAAVVGSALLTLRPLLQDSGVLLHCRGLDSPLMVNGDAEQLRIACGNLLTNAVEALQAMPPQQRQLLLCLDQRDLQACFSVSDSGPGLPSNALASLPLSSTKADGLGLGLFITQVIARHHGGHLRAVRCEELGGAKLSLTVAASA